MTLGWPMLASGGYLIFGDTSSYIRGGQIIRGMVTDLVMPGGGEASPAAAADATSGGGAGTGAAMTNDRDQPVVMRSFPYSLYTLFAGAAIWPAGFALLQAAGVIFMLFALIGSRAAARPWILAGGFVYLATLTTLPWSASYLMPDLLAAAVILWGAILAGPFDGLSAWQRWVLGAIAAFAAAAHYGHVPLAAALFAAVLLWRAATRRLTWAVAIAAVLPVMLPPLANLAASAVVLDTPSTTPLRLPILLARSIEDGPARWYLQDACPEADLAFCRAFGDQVPEDISEFLWEDGGIDSLTPRQLAGIRDEEFTVLVRAFAAYPVEQTLSLTRNAAEQVVTIGTGQISVARWLGGAAFDADRMRGRAVLEAFDDITPLATWTGAALLLGLWLSGRMDRQARTVVTAVILGLLLNAAIFGGLSAPVDRYQARVAWLLPALAAICLAASRPRTGRPA